MIRRPCPALRLLRRNHTKANAPTEVQVVVLMRRHCARRLGCYFLEECQQLYVKRGEEWEWRPKFEMPARVSRATRPPRAHLRGQSDWMEHKVPGIERVGVLW